MKEPQKLAINITESFALDVIIKHACNNKYAMHNVRITAAYKKPSYTQSTVFFTDSTR